MKRATDRIAFFDFDGTLTRNDTLLEIIKYICGNFNFYFGFLALSPVLILYKLHIIPNWRAKEIMLSWFFKGKPYKEFQQKCNQFALEVIPLLLRKDGVMQLEDLYKDGVQIVIVSASAENWIAAWCEKHHYAYIATRLEVRNGRLTGKITGSNCHGEEKVIRIKKQFDLNDFLEVYAFGDSKGDIPMLKLATKPYYRAFKG